MGISTEFSQTCDEVNVCIDRLREAITSLDKDQLEFRPPHFMIRWKRTSDGDEPPFGVPLQVPDEEIDYVIGDRGVWYSWAKSNPRRWTMEEGAILISKPEYWQLLTEARPDEKPQGD